MKISDIKCYLLESPAPAPRFAWRAGLPSDDDGTPTGQPQQTALLKVETDEGIVGMAESWAGPALLSLTRRRLKSFIGADPLLTEQRWHEVWEIDRIEEMRMDHLGLLDVALWDIKSRKAGLPIYQLLGGSNPRVRAYASTVTWPTMEEYERHIKVCLEEGFTAFKLHAWGDPQRDATLCRNLRRWAGPDADLMFDGSAGWDYVTALRFGRVLEELGFLWYEEPMREFDLASYAELARQLDIPILAAETSDGCHWNAATWIHLRALDMMRVSACFKGGFTGALKVAHLAESFGMRAQVHGGGPAEAQLCAAIGNNDAYEQLVIDVPQIQGLKHADNVPIVDGWLTVANTPGLPHPDWDAIADRAVAVA